jgi:Ca2+-binding EF-hand superfamily protein
MEENESRKLFNSMDVGKTGAIDFQDFVSVYSRESNDTSLLKLGDHHEDCNKNNNSTSIKKTRLIRLSSVEQGLSLLQRQLLERLPSGPGIFLRAWKVFRREAMSKANEPIGRKQFITVLKHIGLCLTQDDTNAIYDVIDRNNSGKIEYDDFVAFIEERKSLRKNAVLPKKSSPPNSNQKTSSTKRVKSRLSRSIRKLERQCEREKCELKKNNKSSVEEFVVSGSSLRSDSKRAKTHLSRCAEESLLSSANFDARPSPYVLPSKPVGPQVEYAKRPIEVALDVDVMGRKGLFQSPRRR